MRRVLSHIVMVLLFAISPLPASAQDAQDESKTLGVQSYLEEIRAMKPHDKPADNSGRGLHVGNGFSGDSKDLDVETDSCESTGEKGQSHEFGLSPKAGHEFGQGFSLQLDLDHLSGLQGKVPTAGSGSPAQDESSAVDVTTYTPLVKFSPYADSKMARPYVVGGFGLMRAEASAGKTDTAFWFLDPDNEADLEASGKVGLGLEIRKNNTSVDIEGNYASGFGDLSEVVYESLRLGVSFHW